jgi:hypothetical protein
MVVSNQSKLGELLDRFYIPDALRLEKAFGFYHLSGGQVAVLVCCTRGSWIEP